MYLCQQKQSLNNYVNMEQTSGKSPALRESVTELFTERKVDHERSALPLCSAKMKKVLFTVVLLATTFVAQAQNNYHDALKAYMKACPSALVGTDEKMGEALKLVNEKLITDYNGMTSEQLVNKYMKEQYLDDMIDKVLLPVVEKNATIAEINELTAAMSTPAGRTYQEHQKKLNSQNKVIEELSMEVMQAIMAGTTPKPVAVKSGCPQSYVKQYEQFFKVSGLQSVVSEMGNVFGDKKDTPEVQKFIKYMEDNVQTIYLNKSYGIMTTDDLKFGTKLYKTEAWKHMMKTTTDMMQDSQSVGLKIVMAYISWLQEQGVKLNLD